MSTRATRLGFAVLAVSAPACALIVGVGDHKLRPDDASVDAGGDVTASDVGEAGPGDAAPSDGAPSDGGGPVVLASGLQRPTGLIGDLTDLFWIAEETDAAPGAILSMPVGGGTPRTLVSGIVRPVAVRTTPTLSVVYFTADGIGDASAPGIYYVSKDGGPAAALGLGNDGRRFDTFVVRGLYAYSEATDPDGGGSRLRVTDPTGASCYGYETAPGGRIPSIVADNNYVYFADTAASEILAATHDCDASATVLATQQDPARFVSYNSAYVFWMTATAGYRLDHSPNATPFQVASNLPGVQALSFPSTIGSFVACADGSIWRIQYPYAGAVATGQNDPSSVVCAQDGTAYWTNRGSGELLMLAP